MPEVFESCVIGLENLATRELLQRHSRRFLSAQIVCNSIVCEFILKPHHCPSNPRRLANQQISSNKSKANRCQNHESSVPTRDSRLFLLSPFMSPSTSSTFPATVSRKSAKQHQTTFVLICALWECFPLASFRINITRWRVDCVSSAVVSGNDEIDFSV